MLDRLQPVPTKALAPGAGDVIKLAILAVGGQGGGVLSDWIVDVAERNGHVAQSTSVAGVAQRTGATIYYVEMAPDTGRLPIFALSPAQGDVDVLIAAELMEAGRAIMRGFVTPERTTLIASSHRIAAVSEKIEPGDGRASSPKVVEAAEVASLRFISFDMERIAVENGTMISASLLGALAGSGALPFTRESFEAAIKAGGRGADASLAAFGAAYDRARGMASKEAVSIPPHPASAPLGHPLPAGERRSSTLVHIEAGLPPSLALSVQSSSPRRGEGGRAERRPGEGALRKEQQASTVTGPRSLVGAWETLVARVAAMPEAIRDMALRGVRKVVDYQDIAYGRDYLDLLDKAMALDDAAHGYRLSIAAAKHLANALCYDDMIRVADLKTRSARGARVRREVGVRGESILQVTEFFHPRVEEFCGTLPVRLGRYIEDRPKLAAWIDRRINRGRRIRTDSMTGFAMLWVIGGLRRWRRSLLRHAVEAAHLDRWYRLALDHAASDYDLAVEILACRRLIKGYSDTHARAQSKFDRVLSALPILKGRTDAAEWLRRLREAALKDEKGDMLDGALKTVRSFAQDGSATAGQE